LPTANEKKGNKTITSFAYVSSFFLPSPSGRQTPLRGRKKNKGEGKKKRDLKTKEEKKESQRGKRRLSFPRPRRGVFFYFIVSSFGRKETKLKYIIKIIKNVSNPQRGRKL
jgi:hypothetical protein